MSQVRCITPLRQALEESAHIGIVINDDTVERLRASFLYLALLVE